MKLLANENFPLISLHYLQAQGFDVISIGTDNPSISDKQVMDIAIRENRTILTFDRDYGELIFKYNYQPSAGVIYLRLFPNSPEEPGYIIEGLVTHYFCPILLLFSVYHILFLQTGIFPGKKGG